MFNFIKKIFKSDKEEDKPLSKALSKDDNRKIIETDKEKDTVSTTHISVNILDIAPNVYLVHKGARTCVGMDALPNDMTKRLEYVKKIVSRGHDSVLEHSNIISMMTISGDINPTNYAEILANARYCHVIARNNRILIGGSIRAYINIVKETKRDNLYIDYIKEIMYNSIEKEFLTQLIDKGLMDEDKCNYLPTAYSVNMGDEYVSVLEDPKPIVSDKADLLYNTDINALYNKIKVYGFTMKDACEVSIISIFFHDVSRSCANQMTRHRVGISQESQRYVTHDYNKDKDFINPIKLNLIDRYVDKDTNLISKIESVDPFEMYKKLIKDGFVKEDARAWLPMNVTTKLMMTFTYSQLGHFISLRSDKAAQKEIRMLTDSIKSIMKGKYPKPDEVIQKIIDDHSQECNGEIDLASLLIYAGIAYTIYDEMTDALVQKLESPDEIIDEATETLNDMPEHLDTNTMVEELNNTIKEEDSSYDSYDDGGSDL